MTIPLSKTLDPADYAELADELQIVNHHFRRERPQHEARRWEYAMALRARRVWLQADYEHYGHANRTHGHRIFDVGGAGSPFRYMVGADASCMPRVIDPDEEPGFSLEQFLRRNGQLAHEVYCLSVLEHVDDLDQFLYHLSCLTAPGGLLFLTIDHCGCDSHHSDADHPDRHHFHWMRKRIFGRSDLVGWAETLLDLNLDWLGERDLTYHGPQVYDYSFASLAMVKRP